MTFRVLRLWYDKGLCALQSFCPTIHLKTTLQSEIFWRIREGSYVLNVQDRGEESDLLKSGLVVFDLVERLWETELLLDPVDHLWVRYTGLTYAWRK